MTTAATDGVFALCERYYDVWVKGVQHDAPGKPPHCQPRTHRLDFGGPADEFETAA